jgi:tRNA (mo5U34)-methyltransferase
MSEARNPQVIEESRRQIERLSKLGWYHSIELPDGGVIEGHQSVDQLRRRIDQFRIPADLTGKRVLDIGAWDGWFSFEMERRGAQVLAVDSTKNTRLLEAKHLLGSRVEHHVADICRLTYKDIGTFDIVLFLGVLYHVKHPILALENVCGMTRDMACIESFVSDPDVSALPIMEYYETTELRGQLDNWVGPNAACLMAFCRTAGFARVDFESALGERAHVTGYRQWLPGERYGSAPQVVCIENANTHNHKFSTSADDYVTFYFREYSGEIYPQIGPFAARPIHQTATQATVKLPPGLARGWHEASLNGGVPVRVGLDDPAPEPAPPSGKIRLTRVADGKTFEDLRIRTGEGSCISVWASNLPLEAETQRLRLRLNGTDLPALWHSPESGQINALLPAGLESGTAILTLYFDQTETEPTQIELI